MSVLRGTPTRQGDPSWNCAWWVKEALEGLKADGRALGSCVIEWDRVRDGAMTYCQRKKDHYILVFSLLQHASSTSLGI